MDGAAKGEEIVTGEEPADTVPALENVEPVPEPPAPNCERN